MNKKIITLALAGVLALGGTAAVYAATNNKADAVSNTTSKTVVEDQDKETNDDQELNAKNTKTAITEDQAKNTAVGSIAGGVFKEIELEDENGTIVYSVGIQADKTSYEVKVDANTGAIVKSEQDNGDNEKGSIEKESKGSDNDKAEHENQNDDSNETED